VRDCNRSLNFGWWPRGDRRGASGASYGGWSRGIVWAPVLVCLLGALAATSVAARAQDLPGEVAGGRRSDGPSEDAWVEDQYAIAAQHYRQQRWTQAIGQFRLLLDRAPRHARAGLTHFFLAESHVQLEDYAASLPHFEQFLVLEPDHPLALRARFRLGESHYLLGDDDASIGVLTPLLEIDQDGTYTEFNLAYLGEMWLRDETPPGLTRARDYLQRVVIEYPESLLRDRARLGLAQAHQKLGDSPGAEQALIELAASSDPTIAAQAVVSLAALWIETERVAEVPQILSDDRIAQLPPALQPRARYWRGRAEMAAKNWSQAASWIESSLADLQDPALEEAATYDAAISYWQADQIPLAERSLTTLISRWPAGQWTAESQYLLLQAALRRRDWEQVDRSAAEFLTKFPQHALANQIREWVGRRALGQRDYGSAQQQFAALIDDDDRSVEAEVIAKWHYLLSLSQFGLEQWEVGLGSCAACLALLPMDLAAVSSDSRELPLSVWLEQRSADVARVGTGQTPRTPQEQLWEQAQFARATGLTRLRRWPEALQVQEELLRRLPDSIYRRELWSERLRILAANRDWAEYPAAANVARRWLEPSSPVTSPAEEIVGAQTLAASADTPQSPLGDMGDNGSSGLLPSVGSAVASEPGDSSATDRGRETLRQALSITALQMAEQLYEQGAHAAAIPWYELGREADDPAIVDQALAGLAWAEFQTLPSAEAERTARLLLDRFADNPRSAEVGLKLADQLYRDGRFDAAAELLETLVARFTTWPRRHQLLALQAKLLAQRPQTEAKRQAIAKLQLALESVPPTKTDSSPMAASPRGENPSATYLYELAWLWQDIGDSDASHDCFRQINLKYPNSRHWADATFRLAQHHFSQQRYAVANDLLAQVLAAGDSSSNAERDFEAGRTVPTLTVSSRRESSGQPSLRESPAGANAVSTTVNPEMGARVSAELSCQTLYLRAMTAAAEQDWAGVADWSQRLIDRYPEHRLRWMTQYWRGEADFRQRQYTGAVATLSEILPRTSNQTDSWVAMTHLRLAQSLGHLDRWPDALEVAEAARARFANFAQTFEFDYLIGRAQATEGRFSAARAAYQQVNDSPAAARSETAAMAQWMVGETYMHQEQYALAAEAYHRVETLHRFRQWQAAALLQAGKCYEQLGRRGDAIGVYRQLLREHADCSLVDAARVRLENLTTLLGKER